MTKQRSMKNLALLVLMMALECNTTCPPANFSTKSDFNLGNYIKHRWYALKQLPVVFQPPKSLYCVRAQYSLDTQDNWWCKIFKVCDRVRINVLNEGRNGGIHGKLIQANLYGIVMDTNDPARLKIGPKGIPINLFGGPYWVVEAATYHEVLAGQTKGFTSTDYDWALIVGGELKVDSGSNGKCITGKGRTNSKGIWILSREPVPPAGVLEKLEQIAEIHGIDTSTFLPVTQQGCDFNS